jgi:hypothetical protein
MLHRPRTPRTAIRRALAISAVLHGLVAIPVIQLIGSRESQSPSQGLDTRLRDVTLRLPAEVDAPIEVFPDTQLTPIAPRTEPTTPPLTPEPLRPLGATPASRLPAELQMILRRWSQPGAPLHAAAVTPAGSQSATPLHGALRPGHMIVYILDCSGSMGEFGKFEQARAALMATLRQQPDGVRFQIIIYSTQARPLLAGGRLLANPRNIADADEHLARLEPRGASNHLDAIRAAAELRPDFILMLTDTAELPAQSFQIVRARAGKAVPVCLAQVQATGVATPREVR